MAKAHENIDNEIIANTLQEIAHTQRGEGMDLLYKALTKKGERRFIHAYEPTSGDIDARKEIRDWKGNMLRREIEQNPSFADTISYEKGMEQLAPRESITSKILKALGIYQDGGEVRATGRRSLQDLLSTDWGGYKATGAFEIDRPEGKRWYMGEDTSRDLGLAVDKAQHRALSMATQSPEDSLVTGGLAIEEVLANLNKPKESPKKKKSGYFKARNLLGF